jgi:hypothetical protein
VLLLEAARSMNCSALSTAPRSSRYFSLRNRCDLASFVGYQGPLRLNVHDEASSLDSGASISALAIGEREAALPAEEKATASKRSSGRFMSPAAPAAGLAGLRGFDLR